ncbi:acyl-CoA synthetase [Segnochrobactraceae bacterium EtOH-i3]
MMHPSYFATVQPDKVAYRMAGSGESLTYADLDRLSNQGAQTLRALGVGQGEVIGLLFENRLDYLALCWAAQRSGIFFTAISNHLSVDEILYILRDCGAKIMVLSDTYACLLPALEAGAPEVKFFISGGTPDAAHDWQALQAAAPATPVADEAAGTDMLYSSGTTGRPKGILRTFRRQPIDTVIPLVMTVLCETMGGMDADSVFLSPAPLYHAAPLRVSMMAVKLGGTAILMEKFDPEGVLALIDRYKVTHAQFVPTMFIRLLRLPEEVKARYDHSSLKIAFHAAAPCPADVKAAMIAWWGPILIEFYAGSEANGVTITTSEEWRSHPGTVGRSLLGRIVVIDGDGQELPAGQVGAIYFDSGIDFEYRNDPDKTKGAFLRPGCATIGDIGYVDADGYLYLTDRASYTIISGGVNIYPQETEDLLLSHPDVADAAVFGVPNAEMGEEVKAVVQLEPHAEPSDELARALIEWCRARLSHLKVPRSIDFREALPRTPTGKLMKRKIKDEYWPAKVSA